MHFRLGLTLWGFAVVSMFVSFGGAIAQDPPTRMEYRARQILVATEDLAKVLIREINQGADFSNLARAESLDSGSKAAGGDLGWFELPFVAKPFAEAVVKLKKGGITQTPVRSELGWHIIKLEETRGKQSAAPARLAQPQPDLVAFYPPSSRRAGEEGVALVRIYVNADGTTGEAQVATSSGFPALDQAALQYARSLRFFPAVSADGKLTSTWHPLRIRFTLDPNNGSGGAPSANSSSDVIDVSFAGNSVTRPVTDEELAALSSSLYWDPVEVPLSLQGSAESRLRDGAGRVLAQIHLAWTDLSRTQGGPRMAFMTATLENRSNCIFDSSSTVLPAGTSIGSLVSAVDWLGWVHRHQPRGGQRTQVSRSFRFPENYGNTLRLVPGKAESALSQCRVRERQEDATRESAISSKPGEPATPSVPTVPSDREDSHCRSQRNSARDHAAQSRSMIAQMEQMGGAQFGRLQRLNAQMWESIADASCADLSLAEPTLSKLYNVDPSPAGMARMEQEIGELPISIRGPVLRHWQEMRSITGQ